MPTRHPRHPKNPFIPIALLLVLLLVVVAIRHEEGSQTPFAYAGASQNVSGFAWSQTIGWISFNSRNCDTNSNGFVDVGVCGGTDTAASPATDYGVNLDFVTGNLSGFAWSPSIGYINFNPTPDAATGCTAAPCARLDLVTNNVNGFIRACLPLTTGTTTCAGTTMQASSVLGGWDGWIKLTDPSWTNPANYGYVGSPGTTYDAGAHHGIYFDPITTGLRGFAWGGQVVGWVDFAPVLPPACGVCIGVTAPAISVTPIVVDFGDTDINSSKTTAAPPPLPYSINNTGPSGSFLTGTITMSGGAPFTLSSGNAYVSCTSGTSCTYTAIPSGSAGVLNITFAPTVVGDGQNRQITFDSTEVTLADVVKTVQGNGVLPITGGGTGGLDFGNVVVGKTKDLVLTITNSGGTPFADTLVLPSSVYTCVPSCNVNIPAGGSQGVTIRFAPTAVQAYNGDAYFFTYPSVIFPFTGAGVTGSFQFKDQ